MPPAGVRLGPTNPMGSSAVLHNGAAADQPRQGRTSGARSLPGRLPDALRGLDLDLGRPRTQRTRMRLHPLASLSVGHGTGRQRGRRSHSVEDFLATGSERPGPAQRTQNGQGGGRRPVDHDSAGPGLPALLRRHLRGRRQFLSESGGTTVRTSGSGPFQPTVTAHAMHRETTCWRVPAASLRSRSHAITNPANNTRNPPSSPAINNHIPQVVTNVRRLYWLSVSARQARWR